MHASHATYYDGGYVVKTAQFTGAAGGVTEMVAAVTGKAIRVLYLDCRTVATGTVQFKSATTALTPALPVVTGAQILWPYAPKWIQTAAGEALNVDTAATAATAYGVVGYIEV